MSSIYTNSDGLAETRRRCEEGRDKLNNAWLEVRTIIEALSNSLSGPSSDSLVYLFRAADPYINEIIMGLQDSSEHIMEIETALYACEQEANVRARLNTKQVWEGFQDDTLK